MQSFVLNLIFILMTCVVCCSLAAHAHSRQHVVALPGSDCLARSRTEYVIRVWNADTGECEAALTGHTDRIAALTSLSDTTLASGSWDGSVKIWRLANGSGECVRTFGGFGGRVTRLSAVSSNRLVIAHQKGIEVWNLDARENKCELNLTGGGQEAHSVTALVTLSHNYLASGYKNGKIVVWNANSGERERTLVSHRDEVTVLVVLASVNNHRMVASGSEDKSIKIWDYRYGDLLRTLTGQRSVVSLASLGSGRLASSYADSSMRVWNAESGDVLKTFDVKLNAFASLVCNKSLVVATWDSDHFARGNTIRLWNLDTEKCERTLVGESMAQVTALIPFANSSKRLVSASTEHPIQVLNVTSGECVRTLYGHLDDVDHLASLSPGDSRLASMSDGKTVRIWNWQTGTCEGNTTTLETNYLASSKRVALLPPNGGRGCLASGDFLGTIKIFNLESGQCVNTLTGHNVRITALAALTRARLASGSADGSVRIWNWDNSSPWSIFMWTCARSFHAHTSGHVTSLSELSNNRLASASASSTNDTAIRIWNIRSGQLLRTLPAPTGGDDLAVVSMVTLADGGHLVASYSDDKVRIWNVENGECARTLDIRTHEFIPLPIHDNYASSSHFINLLASVDPESRAIRIWNAHSGDCIRTFLWTYAL